MGTVDVLNGRPDAGRGRRLLRDHRRQPTRPTVGPTTCSPRRGARVLHPRRPARLGAATTPTTSTVERLGAAPTTPPLTLDEQAERDRRDDGALRRTSPASSATGCTRRPPNHFSLAWSADQHGALRNQVYVAGPLPCSQPDEAFVVDVSDGGAEYFTVPLGNIWGTTLDILDRTGSLNKAQSRAERRRHLHLRHLRRGPRRAQLDRHRRAATRASSPCGWRSSPSGGATRRTSPRPGRVVEARRPRPRAAGRAPRVDAAERADQLAARRAAYLRRLPEGLT